MKRIVPTLVLGSVLAMVVLPAIVLAQPQTIPETCKIDIAKSKISECGNYSGDTCNPENDPTCGMCCMMNTLYTATNWLFMILMVIAVIMIVVGGFIYITAAGDPDKASKAKMYIVYALIGIAIAVFAKVLPSIIRFIMGV